jgi:tRNA(fMet)-specific endonuclease VapC
MKYLLDTSILSEFLLGQPAVLARLKSMAPADLAVSSLSIMELRYGLIRHPDRATRVEPMFSALLACVNLIDFTPG